MSGWIGIDLDGTLAHMGEGHFDGSIGEPIKPMVSFVKHLLFASSYDVKIFTARVSPRSRHNDNVTSVEEQIALIKAWTKKHIGRELEVTCEKDYDMVALYDDRARQVEFNTGRLIGEGEL